MDDEGVTQCWMCMGGGGGCELCQCCQGKGEHIKEQPRACLAAKRNALGLQCQSCGALWDESCDHLLVQDEMGGQPMLFA